MPLLYSGTERKRMNYEEKKEKVKVATKARKETQIIEKTNRKLTKCVLGAAGDSTGTRFTGLSSIQHLQPQ